MSAGEILKMVSLIDIIFTANLSFSCYFKPDNIFRGKQIFRDNDDFNNVSPTF